MRLHSQRPASKPHFRSVGRKDCLVTRVVRAIEGQILDGHLAVGTRLPPERDLAESLGVSRPVVREAVRILVTKGLLETRHGIGTTVRAITRAEVVKPLNLLLRTCGQDVSIEHLHQVRSILEIENASLAAEMASEQDLEALRAACAAMQASSSDPQQFVVNDDEFHRRLAQTTHNPLLMLLLDSIHDLMSEVRAEVAHETGLFERVMPTHLRILECIAAQDKRGARRATREHLEIALAIQNELLLRTAP
jgi:DNA-binding FadR family transcriptional regulator